MKITVVFIALAIAAVPSLAAEPYGPAGATDNDFLGNLINRLDPNSTGGDGTWQLQVEGHALLIMTDERADRWWNTNQITTS